MRCPYCGSTNTQVKDPRPSEDHTTIRRRRVCADCDGRFTTFERVQLRELTVIKRSGRRIPFDRDKLMRSIFEGLNDGGLLVLSEKVVDENDEIEQLLVDLHHEHKRRNDYSALEVSRKRAALENVLIPETVAAHRSRLTAAGFRHAAVWLRYFNFVSIIAIR